MKVPVVRRSCATVAVTPAAPAAPTTAAAHPESNNGIKEIKVNFLLKISVGCTPDQVDDDQLNRIRNE